jgi:hypothetical protein
MQRVKEGLPEVWGRPFVKLWQRKIGQSQYETYGRLSGDFRKFDLAIRSIKLGKAYARKKQKAKELKRAKALEKQKRTKKKKNNNAK